jgi:hypothetical protein
MSEENESGLSTLKKTVIGIATTAITAAGAYVTTHIEAIFGGGEEVKTEEVAQPAAAAPAPIILNIENNNTQQQNNGGTKVIERVIEKPAAQPAPVQVVEEKPETPAERMARLKKQREEQNAGK